MGDMIIWVKKMILDYDIKISVIDLVTILYWII